MINTPKTHRHTGAKQARKPREARNAVKKAHHSAPNADAKILTRRGTKQDILIEMLSRAKGATLADLVAANGWQAHSLHGAISGTLKKKLGLAVNSEKVRNRSRVYRIGGARCQSGRAAPIRCAPSYPMTQRYSRPLKAGTAKWQN